REDTRLSPIRLIHHDLRVPVRVGVHPGRIVFLHVDAAVTAVAGEGLVAADIVVWELRAGAEVDAPPGIVYEEAAPMIQDSIVDMRRRVPEWRARGIIRLELVGSFAILHRPVTGQRRALYP